MLYQDFETRQQLALEHRDELAREMRLARGPRPDAAPPVAVLRGFRRVQAQIRSLTRLKASHDQVPQQV
jgi:hypothetical protein